MSAQEKLSKQLKSLLGGETGGEIIDLKRLSGGASRETWSFDLVTGDVVQELILRRDPPFTNAGRTGGMPLEARLFAAAASAGVPVPRLIASGDSGGPLDTGFLVMERVAGETIARKILRDEEFANARSLLAGQLGAAIAKLHAVDPAFVEGLEQSDPLTRYRSMLDALEYPSPTFEYAFRWLEANRPPHTRIGVVHGDYRLGNVIVGAQGLTAVLDWELAHLGDPMEDLGWLCIRAWRFGGSGEAAGVGSLEELFAGYRAAGGVVDEAAVRWWMVVGTLTWGVMCVLQASAHVSLATRSVELAAIGRRVAEQEHDLLDMLGAPSLLLANERPKVEQNGVANAGAGSSVAAATSLFGVPDAAGLIEAVREFLDADVLSATSGRVQFHTRVASNVLATVERELRRRPAAESLMKSAHMNLGLLGNDSDANERELSSLVRNGAFDTRTDELLLNLRTIVTERLAIANPKYLRDTNPAGPLVS